MVKELKKMNMENMKVIMKMIKKKVKENFILIKVIIMKVILMMIILMEKDILFGKKMVMNI